MSAGSAAPCTPGPWSTSAAASPAPAAPPAAAPAGPPLVLKLGGSFLADPQLPQWLQAIAMHGAGRVVLVCGGGPFADAVRAAQAQWHFDELAAHNMATLAMVQTGLMLCALQPGLAPAAGPDALAPLLAAGRVPVWQPWDWLRERPGPDTNWDNTSDAMALELALRLGAPRLLLLKRRAMPAAWGVADWVREGLVDARFGKLAAPGRMPVALVTTLPALLQALRPVA